MLMMLMKFSFVGNIFSELFFQDQHQDDDFTLDFNSGPTFHT